MEGPLLTDEGVPLQDWEGVIEGGSAAARQGVSGWITV